MLSKALLLIASTTAVAVVVIASAGAVTAPVPSPGLDLSNRAAVAKYLASHGIDPKKIVIQRGAKNYAGPHCPGRGWNCTTAKRVVQISYAMNVSSFTCTPSPGGSATSPNTCLIVQFSTNMSNNATCIEKTTGSGVSQSCRILQTNVTGANLATVQQQIDVTTGGIQTGSQYAGIEQDSTTGPNNAQVSQVLNETTTTTAAGGIQQQDGDQTVSVLQDSQFGSNSARVVQSLNLTAKAQYLPFVSQSQNTSAGYPNTAASIRQESGTGTNMADMNQSHRLDATLNRVTTGTQTQGSPDGGMLGHFEQSSSGISVVNGVQNELQQLHATGVPNLTQTQYGPQYFGSDQGTNPIDRYTITQNSTQNASSPSAFQDNEQYANCDTSGVCTAKQTITQDGTTHTNTCTGPSCHIGQGSTDDGSEPDSFTCSGIGSEFPSCPAPPQPPEPPFSSD